ncbi:MAG: VWA domain-containing protein [Deltaproteobacteria bacterium]|nr:VWA domain-containing protein [Deltaproteobacteria bacterium]
MKTNWIETDAYDRAVLARLQEESPSLRALVESGSKLLPHFDGFVRDLFALLFKLNIVAHAEAEVAPSAAFYGVLITHLRTVPILDTLRQQTVLDETRAGLATLLLGERLLELIKSERLLTRAEMLDFWSLEQQEDELSTRRDEAESAAELRQRAASKASERQLGELEGRMRREIEGGQRRLQHRAKQMRSALADAAERSRGRIEAQAQRVAQDLDDTTEQTHSWSLELGTGRRPTPGTQLELGRRLANNRKLRRLAQMVGRMRESALALRQKMFERASAEVYDIGLGAELSRLLPPELLALRQRALRRDFSRRLLDGQLLQYALRAPQEKGRGPMIVCLDGSSSMAGDKEIWSKAVTLTLLDIARRQRRRFRSICFSSADMPLQVLDLNQWQLYEAQLPQVLELAEYFPGGGTDFQKPLSAALECLRHTRHRRGDIVFITDGECRVTPEWLSEFKREKQRLGFSLFSVLIDIGPNALATLREFSDKIATISQLSSDAGRDIFLKL